MADGAPRYHRAVAKRVVRGPTVQMRVALETVRGRGGPLTAAKDKRSGALDPYLAEKGLKDAIVTSLEGENGLIGLRCGTHHNVIRTLMPLTIPDDQLTEGLDMLGAALGEVAAGR